MGASPPREFHVFLSHSGRQKGFATDLYNRLSSFAYSVFFDQDHHCLPPGQPFPPHIFSAANTCTIAILVLSPDFVTSRWPMLELCAFVDRLHSQAHGSDSPFTILPLFFELSPADLKDSKVVEGWRESKWRTFEKEDGCGRITADKCTEAITKHIPRLNGIVRGAKSQESESSFIERVLDAIFRILPLPSIGPDEVQKFYSGQDRLCKIIVNKFRELQATHPDPDPSNSTSTSTPNTCVLGMYGVPGSGKSTLCRFLCESKSMLEEFGRNVIPLELPGEFDHRHASCDYLFLTTKYRKFLSTFIPHKNLEFMDLNKACGVLNGTRSSQKMLLVLDNISPDNYESYKTVVHTILNSPIVGSGSKILLISRSRALLEDLLRNARQRWTIMEVPSLSTSEAMEIMRHRCPSVKEDLMTQLLSRSSFQSSSVMYVPFVFEQIGVLLGRNSYSDMEELWEIVTEGKKGAVQQLVDLNFQKLSEELQCLFLDIVLFIIPATYSKLKDALIILSGMRGISNTVVKMKIWDLQKHCLVSVMEDELRAHDIFEEYTKNIPWCSASYFNHVEPPPRTPYSSRASWHLPMVRLNCLKARTVNIDAFFESPCHYYNHAGTTDQVIQLHLELGNNAKALIVRNSSRRTQCVLDLSGELSSLICLKTVNVQQIVFSSPGNGTDLANLVWLELINIQNPKHAEIVTSNLNQVSEWMSNFMEVIRHPMQNGTRSMKRFMVPLFASEVLRYPTAKYNEIVSRLACSGRMSRLKVLILDNAGIQRLEGIGRYCPELGDLEVRDDANELMFVSIGEAPKLKGIVIGTSFCPRYAYHGGRCINRLKTLIYRPTKSSRLLSHLEECPKLHDFWVDEDCFDDVEVTGSLPSSSRHVAVANDKIIPLMLTSLIPSRRNIDQLPVFEKLELQCKMVEDLEFSPSSLGCLPSLERLELHDCANLTHLSMDASCLPKLRSLAVEDCEKLQVLEGLESLLEQLLRLKFRHLPQLQCDVKLGGHDGTCVQLEGMVVYGCEGVKVHLSYLVAASTRPKSLDLIETFIAVPSRGKQFHILDAIQFMGRHLEFLQSLGLSCVSVHHMDDEGVSISVSMGEVCSDNCNVCSNIPNCDSQIQAGAAWNATAPQNDPSTVFFKGQFTCLTYLSMDCLHLREIEEIQHLHNLRCLWIRNLQDLTRIEVVDGIQHLQNLESLDLDDLPKLPRVSGIWPRSIQSIRFVGCPMLLEIAPLDNTPWLSQLVFDGCVKLKAVEGSFREMKELICMQMHETSFVGCESMEAFPMGELLDNHELVKRRESLPERFGLLTGGCLRVRGSKFASVEEMRRWLAISEFGSLVFEAAVQALMCAYVKQVKTNAHMLFPSI